MKRLLSGIMLLLAFTALHAAEPVIDVPALPPEEKLEPFELDEAVYIPKVLETYSWAVMLQTQLEILGVEPKTKVFPPTYDELIELDVDVIVSYHNRALALEKEVREAPADMTELEIKELRERIKKLKKDIFVLEKAAFENELKSRDVDFYREKNEDLMGSSDSLRHYSDSIKYHYYQEYVKKTEKLKARYDHLNSSKVALISIAGSGNKFFFDEGEIENDVSAGAMLTFNAMPLMEYGKYFEFWAAYTAPRITTVQNVPVIGASQRVKWITDLYSFGISLTFNDILRTDPLNFGFKAGAGYYWGESEASNTNFADTQWRGEEIRLELNLDNDSEELPLEFFTAWNFYFPSKDMNFVTNAGAIPNMKKNFYRFSIGLRMSLWNVPDYSD